MKKQISLILLIGFTALLTGCGNNDTSFRKFKHEVNEDVFLAKLSDKYADSLSNFMSSDYSAGIEFKKSLALTTEIYGFETANYPQKEKKEAHQITKEEIAIDATNSRCTYLMKQDIFLKKQTPYSIKETSHDVNARNDYFAEEKNHFYTLNLLNGEYSDHYEDRNGLFFYSLYSNVKGISIGPGSYNALRFLSGYSLDVFLLNDKKCLYFIDGNVFTIRLVAEITNSIQTVQFVLDKEIRYCYESYVETSKNSYVRKYRSSTTIKSYKSSIAKKQVNISTEL